MQPLRPAAPLDGPLDGSGAAPDPPPRVVPRPRRPWLTGGPTGAPNPPTVPATPTAPNPATGSAPATTSAGPDSESPAGDAESAPPVDAAEAGQAATTVDGAAGAPKSDPGRRRRIPFAHALR
ncbi:murein transglycosylase, partial [Micromonospora sp. CV4]